MGWKVDWDLLWIFYADGEIWATPAIGDVDDDGILEVVIGCSTINKLYISMVLNLGNINRYRRCNFRFCSFGKS